MAKLRVGVGVTYVPSSDDPPDGWARALQDARTAAAAWGVTRLADVTRLDRIGVPVFQAIRPESRALCVHQGKSFRADEARLGALMESLESAHAEAFAHDGPTAPFTDLPATARPPSLADFVLDRAEVPPDDAPIAWTPARRLVDGAAAYAPFDCISLDFTVAWDGRMDRTSCGLAARFDPAGAELKGLFEALERDADAEWRALPDARRSATRVDRGAIAYPWFRDLDERVKAVDAGLAIYAVPALSGLPAVRAAVFEKGPRRRGRVSTGGWGCAASWEAALKAAVLEAVQARLTAISASRDDILYAEPGEPRWYGDAAPLPPGMPALDWARVTEQTPDVSIPDAGALARRLADASYPDASAVTLSAPGERVCVVKIFAPGLGANRRRRRAPLRAGAGR
jgi:ribosomal protein S12 methylthiotransferase accessory factor